MNKVVILVLLVFCLQLGHSQPWMKDTTFNSTGIVTTDFFGKKDHSYSIVEQNDGKILVSGFATENSMFDFAMARYLSNGEIDSLFGSAGKIILDFNGGNDNAYDLGFQSDGKIVIGGYATNGSNVNYALARFDIDGVLDTSFGISGKITHAFASTNFARKLGILPDDKILLSGYSGDDFSIARFHSNGRIDTTFGDSGWKIIDFFQEKDLCYGMEIQSDGSIFLAGHAYNGADRLFAIAKLKDNGILDNSFDSDGKATYSLGPDRDRAYGLTVQSDGKVLICGNTLNGSDYDVAILRIESNGQIDTTFGNGGFISNDILGYDDYIWDIEVLSDGKIVAGGYTSNGSNDDFLMVRYNNSGTLDTTFGDGGILIDSINNEHDRSLNFLIQSNGSILKVGYTDFNSEGDLAIIKYIGEKMVVSTNQFSLNEQFYKVYPIPVSTQLNIDFQLTNNSIITMELYSLDGKLMQIIINNKLYEKGLINETFSISLPGGLYILKISEGDKHYSVKILKSP